MKYPFIIGLHNHQPVNNFSFVIDEAAEKSYLPFLKTAVKFPKFRFVLHYSGWLLDYIIKNHKEIYRLLKKLTESGQAEFFTGGYYEPILSAIPSADRIGQINKLSDTVEKHFHMRPKGLWLTERVWDGAIIPDLVKAGIEDVIVDDYHFISAGYSKSSIKGYFRSEQDGFYVNIFPVDKGLRYKIPFSEPEDVIKYIKDCSSAGKKFLVCFDDGEKFGLWPDTYKWVYEKGWLERFMEQVSSDDDIETAHFKDIKTNMSSCGIAYLPVASYPEMGEWALFSDAQVQYKHLKDYIESSPFKNDTDRFVKAGIWKNFLVKYPEANRIHKRTLSLSRRNDSFKQSGGYNKKFEELLYMSQCNDCLWHGSFGGLYLPNLRDNAWNSIIEAEKVYEKLTKQKFPSFSYEDVDLDGYKELYIRMKDVNIQFAGMDGAQIKSIECKEPVFNFGNTLSRRKEGYHELFMENAENSNEEEPVSEDQIATIHDVKPEINQTMKDQLCYDWYNKNCFIDHFVTSDNFSNDSFEKGKFHELGDFVNQPFTLKAVENPFCFTRHGALYTDNGRIDAFMSKTYEIIPGGLKACCKFESSSKARYVQEHNLHFADYGCLDINGTPFDKIAAFNSDVLCIKDNNTGRIIEFKWDRVMDIYVYTVNTVSLSVDTMELTAQGICALASFDYEDSFSLDCSMRVLRG